MAELKQTRDQNGDPLEVLESTGSFSASQEERPPNPLLNASFLSRMFFTWPYPILKLGMERPLEEKDLAAVAEVDSSVYNLTHFNRVWAEEQRLRPKNPSLARALLKDFHYSTWRFVQPILFVGYTARVVQAVVLGKLIESFEGGNDRGYQWAGIIVVCGVIILFQCHHPFQITWRKGMQIRIACVAAIADKSLRLSSTHQDTSNSYGRIMNLASNDVERFLLASIFLNQLFWAPAQAIGILAAGWTLFGVPFIAGWALFVGFFLPAQIYLCRKFASYRSQIAAITDARVTFVSQAVSGARAMKMSGYEWRFLDRIQKYRLQEITKIRRSNRLKAWNDALYYVSNVVVSLFIFLIRIWTGGELTTVDVFQIFALVNIMQLELARGVALAVMAVSECYVSVGRIQKFLEFPELPRETMGEISSRMMLRQSQRSLVVNMDGVALSFSRVRCYWNKVDKMVPMKDIGRRQSYLSTKPALDFLNIEFKFGELTAVIGPVGCGKSAFLLALVQELPIQHGIVRRCYDDLAYAAQEPWIMDGSVRENIVMDLGLDEIWYDKVVTACGLKTDFQQWRDGDGTVVGDQGVQCSGGQRARIGFARALYRDSDVLVADDPLSAIDARVGRQLFDEAIMGLALKRGKCVILATHQHQHIVDFRCVLVTDGRIRCIGRYEACVEASHGGLSPHIADDSTNNASSCSILDMIVEERLEEDDEIPDEQIPDKRKHVGRSASKRMTTLRGIESVRADKENKEMNIQGFVSSGTFLNYLRAMGGVYIGYCLFVIYSVTQAGVLLTFTTVGRWADRPHSEQDNWDIYGVIFGLGGFVVVFAFFRAFLSFYLVIKASQVLHDQMAEAVLRAKMEFFDTNPLGRIMNRFSADVGSNDDLLPPTLVDFFTLAFILVGTILMAVVNLPFTLVALPPLMLYFNSVRRVFVTSSREIKRLECIARSPIYVMLSQSLGGIATIRANNATTFFRKKFAAVQEAHTRTVFAYISASRWFGFRVDAIMFLFLTVVCFGSVLFQQEGWFDVDPTILGLIVAFLLQFAGMFQWAMRLSAEAVNQMVSVERVFLFGRLEPEAPLVLDTDKAVLDRGWPQEGRIEIQNLSVRYRSALPRTLKNVSCVIPAGSRVGIVGRTGSGYVVLLTVCGFWKVEGYGCSVPCICPYSLLQETFSLHTRRYRKSTLVQTLFRLIEAETGFIKIDGVDIASLGLHTLRTGISVIPQTPTLFSGCSIRENLDLFSLHTDGEIERALISCRMDTVVDAMPNGWDTLVTEGGQNFSVGQRQLLCLARAILSHCKILVLDEATAHVDRQTESLLLEALEETFHEGTVLTVAHRLDTVIKNDYIMVLDNGSVVDFGPPAALIRNGGAFGLMVEDTGGRSSRSLQSSAFIKERENELDQLREEEDERDHHDLIHVDSQEQVEVLANGRTDRTAKFTEKPVNINEEVKISEKTVNIKEKKFNIKKKKVTPTKKKERSSTHSPTKKKAGSAAHSPVKRRSTYNVPFT
jgi:ATP-binding cassette subfamily C (CFTR/MRP) protein 4